MKACLAILAATLASANAWWDVGHQTVGAIAKMEMKNEKSRQNLANILTYMDTLYNDESGDWPHGDFNVDATQRPPMKSNELAYAAVWPDVAKGFYNVKLFDNWHYINGKYDPEGLDTEDTGCNTYAGTNIMYVLESLVKQIPDNYKGRPTAHWYQHFGISFLAHNLGDLHQPYHTVGRCMMVDGKLDQDLGGNRWLLVMPDGTNTNAHAVWDSVAFVWGNNKQAEIEAADPTYETFAKELLAKVSKDDLAAAGYDMDLALDSDPSIFKDRAAIWAKESNDLAIESYSKTTLNGTVDQAFIDWVVSTSELRVVMAGYRMAALLDGMLAELDVPAFETKAASAPVEGESGSSSEGMPVWAVAVAAVGGLLVGAVIAFFLGKSRGKKAAYGDESSIGMGEK